MIMRENAFLHSSSYGSDNLSYGLEPLVEAQPSLVRFSFFEAPISNTTPNGEITLLDAFEHIKGDSARKETEMLRRFNDEKRARLFLWANFDSCTFSGLFSSRANDKLVDHSGLLCVGFIQVPDWQRLHDALLADENFDTQLLFRDPIGNGLQWIIQIDTARISHGDYFDAVSAYCSTTYGIQPDIRCREVSHPCFLPCDPEVYINGQILSNNGE